MIRPIETIYNGYRFRSRLEARWAVFFDTLGIEYRYELEGFDLGEYGWYLPDFFLIKGFFVPKEGCYVEIKGKAPNEVEINKFTELCEQSNTEGLLLYGNIGLKETQCFRCVLRRCNCPDCNKRHIYYEHHDNCYFWSPDVMLGDLHNNVQNGIMSRSEASKFQKSFETEINSAWAAARRARFEHGESG